MTANKMLIPAPPRTQPRWWALFFCALLIACTAGHAQFTREAPAGFWLGLWHDLISWITLVIGVFQRDVRVYEVVNSGGRYDFGFLIGVGILWGHREVVRPRKRETSSQEWEQISRGVELKLKRKLREWAEAEPDEAWNLVEQKAEDKLKRRLREWVERP